MQAVRAPQDYGLGPLAVNPFRMRPALQWALDFGVEEQQIIGGCWVKCGKIGGLILASDEFLVMPESCWERKSPGIIAVDEAAVR
jgi:hypothetical protein